MKICNHCKQELELSNFSFRNDVQKYRNVCKQCRAEKEKLRRILQSDEIKEKDKRRSQTEERKEWRKQNAKKNIVRNRALDRERYVRDKEKRLLLSKMFSGKRRKRIKELSDGTINTKSVLLKLETQNNKCYWCNTSIGELTASPDHYIPLAKGGKHSIDNIVLTCLSCNLSKNAKDPIQYANENGRLL